MESSLGLRPRRPAVRLTGNLDLADHADRLVVLAVKLQRSRLREVMVTLALVPGVLLFSVTGLVSRSVPFSSMSETDCENSNAGKSFGSAIASVT